MKKQFLVCAAAALLLVSLTACGSKKEPGAETDTGAGQYIDFTETDTDRSPSTVHEPGTKEPPDQTSEPNPQFKEISKKVCVWTAVATVRSSTIIEKDNKIAWPTEGEVLDVTGESENWYRIRYNGKDAYISKKVVGDNAVLEAFREVSDEVEIESNVKVRSFPSTASADTVRGILAKGTKVSRVGVGEGWSRILFEVKSESETDSSGAPVKTIKQYYISNDCIVEPSTDTGADSETDTEAS